mgnify:CR=1 FL=1
MNAWGGPARSTAGSGGALLRRAAGRLGSIALLVPLLSFGSFALVHAIPGAAETLIVGGHPGAGSDFAERVRRLRALDRSVPERYRCWLLGRDATGCDWWVGGQGVLRGDLGSSRVHGRPVAALLAERWPRTLALMGPAFLLGVGLALPLGAWSALRRGRALDRWTAGLGLIGVSVPLHWVGMGAIAVFGVRLGWLPTSGLGGSGFAAGAHLVLPAGVTGLFFAARWMRYVRAEVADALGAPFARAARARGLPERRVLGASLRAALPPVITVIGHSLPLLVSGSVVVERVFVFPGMGALLLDAVLGDDHLTAALLLALYSAATLFAAALADLLAAALDPRARGALAR